MENLSRKKQIYIQLLALLLEKNEDELKELKELSELQEKKKRRVPKTVNAESEYPVVAPRAVAPNTENAEPEYPSSITITPISGNHRNKSWIDFEEQLTINSHNDSNWNWDDEKGNSTRPGGWFAFWFIASSMRPEGKFIIHRVNDVKSPSHRLSSWSQNVGQGNRNVLQLSAPIFELTEDEWKKMGGPKKKQGTYRIKFENWKHFMTELTQRYVNRI